MENHDFGVIFFQEPFKELESEPAEPVPMGNHHCMDSVLQDEFQKGTQPRPFEVESGADVSEFDKVAFWVELACCCADFVLLISSVLELFPRGYSSITHDDPLISLELG